MKRVVCLVMVVVSVLILSVSFADTMQYACNEDVSAAYIRDYPRGNKKGQIPNWECFYGSTVEGERDWVKVSYNGIVGYVYLPNIHPAHAEELEAWEKRKNQHITVTNEDADFVGVIINDSKVYKKANGKVIGDYHVGDKVYVRQLGKYWYRIIWKGSQIGYVPTRCIQLTNLNFPGEGENFMVVENTSVREEANSKGKKIKTLKAKSYVKVLSEVDDDWVLVMYDTKGNTGFMQKNKLKTTRIFEPKT